MIFTSPFTGMLLSAFLLSACSADDMRVTFIDEQVIPHGYIYEKTVVGGLSSLDYYPQTSRYVTISDDRSEFHPAHFYEMSLSYDLSGFHGWQMTDITILKRPDGSFFPAPVPVRGKSTIDPEALRVAADGQSYFWTSEGHYNYALKPFLRQMNPDGSYLRDFPIPEKYLPAKDTGARENLVFEALTMSSDQNSIIIATEGPLKQDGDEANASHGAPVRLLQFDIKSGMPIHEYVYEIEPIHEKTSSADKFSVNGVTDILAVSTHDYIIIERSYATGHGNSVKLWLASLDEATDVLAIDSLKDATYRPVSKNLLLDLGSLGIEIDNIEGITFGKRLKDGRRTLLLISDNNFSASQKTQILLFAISGL